MLLELKKEVKNMQYCPNCGRNSVKEYPNGDKKCLMCSYKRNSDKESVIINNGDGSIRVLLEQKNLLNPKILQRFQK